MINITKEELEVLSEIARKIDPYKQLCNTNYEGIMPDYDEVANKVWEHWTGKCTYKGSPMHYDNWYGWQPPEDPEFDLPEPEEWEECFVDIVVTTLSRKFNVPKPEVKKLYKDIKEYYEEFWEDFPKTYEDIYNHYHWLDDDRDDRDDYDYDTWKEYYGEA